MPKQGFRTFLIIFLILDLLSRKLLQCDAIEIYYKTYYSKNFNYQYLQKNMFEICSNRVRSAHTHVPASEMPLKLYPEVHLGHVETLNAPGIEISKAEKIIFTENLLHCTATATQKNEILRLH
jgi:hypothetical protein